MYVIGPFHLDPVARELRRAGEHVALPASAFDCLVYLIEHRERPVGKDELIAAVWGRTEISDNLLARHIVRLRRLFDDGTEHIRTVSRVGYRWVGPVSTRESGAISAIERSMSASPREAVTADNSSRRRRGALILMACLAFSLAIIALAVGYTWNIRSKASESAHRPAMEALAAVLPAEIQAAGDWGWLRYGLMEMVANDLKGAGIRAVPSDVVVAYVRDASPEASEHGGRPLFGETWQIEPRATLIDGVWRVALTLHMSDGRGIQVSASDNDIQSSTQKAFDLLLVRLGMPLLGDRRTSTPLDLWLTQVTVAKLSNRLDVAQRLVDEAPQAWHTDPRFAHAEADIQCSRGLRALCEKNLRALLNRLPRDGAPVLRGQILLTLGLRYANANQLDRAAPIIDESIRFLEQGPASDDLANAYFNRAWLAQSQDNIDLATAYLGKGRATYALSGDVYGMARADFEMGLISARRGQIDTAYAFLQKAYDQFAQYGFKAMLPTALDGLAGVVRQQLKYADELAITDKFWPLDDQLSDIHMRRELTYVRAIALADNGRLTEAAGLSNELMRDIDPGEDSALVAEVPELLAQIAFSTRDYPAAEWHARQAMKGGMDHLDQASTWLLLIRTLRLQGRAAEAAPELARFKAWLSQPALRDDWVSIYGDLAEAELMADTDRLRAMQAFEALMSRARRSGVPDLIVNVGFAYATNLLKDQQVDRAMATSGTLSAWARDDYRVVALEASIYDALGRTEARDRAIRRAKELAGERMLPAY